MYHKKSDAGLNNLDNFVPDYFCFDEKIFNSNLLFYNNALSGKHVCMEHHSKGADSGLRILSFKNSVCIRPLLHNLSFDNAFGREA